jgi:ketosteroid isomerase-like protein
MPGTSVIDAANRAVVERYVQAFFAPNALDVLESTLSPDIEVIYPQSGERFRGQANVRAHLENYPGRDQEFTSSVERVVGDDPGWALSQRLTVIRIEGSGEVFTAIGLVRHGGADATHVVQVVEVRDGLIGRVNAYFAAPFEAPDWRAPYREPMGS